MIRRKPDSPPSLYLSTPSPDTSPRSSAVVSDWDADDEETMSMEEAIPTRDPSVAADDDITETLHPFYPMRPTLPDVLSNAAPPPWTLSAFTAYLSQNHCLENLEFTMDAERYKDRFDAFAIQMAGTPVSPDTEECRYVRMLWQRLLNAYIVPDGPREINIPSNVRDTLLSLPNLTDPPAPEELDDAVKIIYNLMEESVLISFLNEIPPATNVTSKHPRPTVVVEGGRKRGGSDSSTEKKSRRSQSRRRTSPTSSLDVPSSPSDPTGCLTPAPTMPIGFVNPSIRAQSHTSSASVDPGFTTDDSASPSSPGREPMTPPTTPPSSDFGGGSPRSRSDTTWKKMLGWKKKSSNGMRDNRFPTVED